MQYAFPFWEEFILVVDSSLKMFHKKFICLLGNQDTFFSFSLTSEKGNFFHIGIKEILYIISFFFWMNSISSLFFQLKEKSGFIYFLLAQ